MGDKLKILACAGELSYRIGGPAHSVTGLCRALVQTGCQVSLCRIGNDDIVSEIAGLDSDYVKSRPLPILGNDLALGFERLLLRRECDLIHTHTVWHQVVRRADKISRHTNKPHIITLRGMLTQWAMSHKRCKKQLGWYLYQKAVMQRATCVHCTSITEMEEYRQLGMVNPVAVIPNGIEMPGEISPDQIRQSKQWLADKWPQLRDKKILLFFSRINPKKGLDMLAEIWNELSGRFPEWHLVIAGPDEAGYQAKIAGMLTPAAAESVLFTGPLYGADKESLYLAGDLFILPTYSENFSIAVGEALSYGIPVITTTGAPWQDIVSYNCGWWVKPDTQAIKTAVHAALMQSQAELHSKGKRGKELIRDKFSWLAIARQMTNVYKWVLLGSDMPDCVYIE